MQILKSNLIKLLEFAVEKRRQMGTCAELAAWEGYLKEVKEGATMLLAEDPGLTCKELNGVRELRWRELHDTANAAIKAHVLEEFPIGAHVHFKYASKEIRGRVIEHPEFSFSSKLKVRNSQTGTIWDKEPWDLELS